MGKWEKSVAIQACPRENVLPMTTYSGLHMSIKNLLQIFHNYAYWFESWQSNLLFSPFLVWLSPYVAVFYEINSSDLPIIIAKHDLLEDI